MIQKNSRTLFPYLKFRNWIVLAFLALVQLNNAYAGTFFQTNALKFKIAGAIAASMVTMQTADTASTGPTFTDSASGSWSMKYENEVALIPFDDLLVPVVIKKPAVILTHSERGRFRFSEGKLFSVSRTPVVTATNAPGKNFNVRPTLFISLEGFSTEAGPAPWGNTLEQKLVAFDNATDPHYSQSVHFEVDWDSTKPIGDQLYDLAEVVKDFLKARAYPWDVVIIGHSRGGILAHELSRKLVGQTNIKNLHTVLLEVTAAGIFGDQYPVYKYDASPTTHFASQLYDGVPFAWNNQYNFGIETTTVGDRDIIGYDNYGRGTGDHLFKTTTTHGEFAYNWVIDTNQGFDRTLGDIWARKDRGTFAADGNSWMEVIRIRQKDVAIAGDLRIVDGKLAFDGSINLGPAQASMNGFIGRDGVEITTSVFVATAQVSIREDHIALSANTGLTSMSASIANDGLNVHTDMMGLASSGVSIGSGNVEISGNLGGSHGVAADVGTGGVHISVGGTEILGASGSTIAGSVTGVTTSIGHSIGIHCCSF